MGSLDAEQRKQVGMKVSEIKNTFVSKLDEKEAALIEALIRNPDHVQSKEFLLAHVWGSDSAGEDNYVEVYISYLRKKLEKLKSNVKIKTIRSLGYKLCLKN